LIFLFASGSCSFGVFRRRKLLGSDLVSSYSAAPEALVLDPQTSSHQIHCWALGYHPDSRTRG
jgi:hypothetical protein